MDELRLVNTHDQNAAAGGDRVVIFYHRQETGRAYRSAGWVVGRFVDGKSISTDPGAPWYDYGRKVFSLSCIGRNFGETLKDHRARVLADAIAWANKKFGIRQFVKNRLGDYVEKEVNEKFPLPKREKK